MKKLYFSLFVAFCGTTLFSQSNFQKAIALPFVTSPTPKKIIQCSDGGYLIAANGYYSGTYLMKSDQFGNIQWNNQYDFASGYGSIDDAGILAGNTGYYILCEGYDSLMYTTTFRLSTIDLNGNVLWSKAYPTGAATYGHSKVKQLPDGGFLISESLYSKMGALRTDASGTPIWNYSFTSDTTIYAKNPSFDVCINGDGSMLTTGKRNNDICIVKSDPNGNTIWTKTLGTGMSYYHANSIAATADGGYIICGYEDYYGFILKVDGSGVMSWYKTYNFATFGYGSFEKVVVLANGNLLLLGGDGYYNTALVTTDAMGNLISSFQLGDGLNTYLSSADFTPTSDGGIALTGFYTSNVNSMAGLVLMKMDASMNSGCELNPTSVTSVIPTYGSPIAMSIPFYHLAETGSFSNVNASASSNVTYESDFCLLFSTNDPSAIKPEFTLYPSPLTSGSALNLQLSGVTGDVIVNIFDATGKLVMSTNSSITLNSLIHLSTENMTNGIYFVRVTDMNSNLIGESKFIIQ